MRTLTPEEIHYMDAGWFTLGCDELRRLVSQVFTKLPAQIVEEVMGGCRMLMVTTREGGTYLPSGLFGHADVIALPESLLDQDPEVVEDTILHEVAHHVLRHKSPVQQIDLDYDAQEREADALVKQWLETPQRKQTIP